MAKAKTRSTTNRAPRHEPADDWRLHQLRRRAHGNGEHPMPHGRYSATKKTLRNGVVARLALSPEQDALLTEMATLVYYSDGFTYTRPMMKLVKSIADRATPAAQHACLAQAHTRELVR
jgi:hypothetical protein